MPPVWVMVTPAVSSLVRVTVTPRADTASQALESAVDRAGLTSTVMVVVSLVWALLLTPVTVTVCGLFQLALVKVSWLGEDGSIGSR